MSAVEQAVQAHLILSTRRAVPLRATLRYLAGDPLAVRLGFPAEFALDGEPVPADVPEITWVFARELLADGVDRACGEGDVHVRPSSTRHTLVELRSPEGTALVRFPSPELRRFLWRSHALVAPGQEHRFLDADRALAQLLG
ncbi:SsgA family sporulation/cell division regulator [Kitasatospora sp. NPDC096147]|uniref:SsgA family sporulation/cell division regulator n=1 Tax=Kitasatospora sp. NPDC096147 TaxID=3364093 RepID=UPI003821AE29